MPRLGLVVLVSLVVVACGSGTSGPVSPSTPAPTPTPEPAGTIRLVASTLPAGSTVAVAPMFELGQQAPQLRFTGAIRMRAALAGAVVRAHVRTEAGRCMGGGQARVDFEAGVERDVAPLGMSHPGHGAPLCTLPYTTTQVELEVFDPSTERQVLAAFIPAVYHFVPE